MKLPLREAEYVALRRELAHWEGIVSSALLQVEALRACARYGAKYAARAEAALERVALVPVDDAILTAAGRLLPPTLRTLDAVHVATALDVRSDIGVVIAYDTRLVEAAAAHGLRVDSPV